MGLHVAVKYPSARAAFDQADEVLGYSLSRMCFEGPSEELMLTENTQPAILAVSTAIYRVLEDHGVRPDFVAGHSLGEYAALVAAGSIDFKDALGLVRRRGRYMQDAVPVGVGAMAAILGIDVQTVGRICESAAAGQTVAPANINSLNQVVIAGHREAVERAVEMAKTAGARKSVMLAVSAPFHCTLLKPAEERLVPDLRSVAFRDLNTTLVTNVDAKAIRTAAEARDALERQVSRPVRWLETVQFLLSEGVTRFIEVGPGKTLCGLVKSVDRNVGLWRTDDENSLDLTLKAFL